MNDLSTIQGQLTNAYKHGGDRALWNIARGRGPAAEKAREVIELSTSPFHDVDLYQAISIICAH